MSISRDRQAGFDISAQPTTPPPPRKMGRETAQAALLLLASLAVFFWPAVFDGRVLLPADLIFDLDPLWQPYAPQGYTHPSNRILSDQVYAFFPWQVYARRSLRQGRLPLWNPYANGGQPFVGNAQSAIFNPFNIVGYLLPLYPSYVVTTLLRLFVAGIFTYLFAREIGISKPGALLAMLAFTFSEPMIVWVGYPPASVIAWLPAMLFTAERMLTRRGTLPTIANGLTIGAQFLGGHPETSLLVMLAWAAYVLYRAVALKGWQFKELSSRLTRAIAAAAMGGALAAAQLLPFAEAVLGSAILVARQGESAISAVAFFQELLFDWHSWPTAITILLPRYFGTPLNESYLYPFSNYVEQTAYVGVLPLALAISTVWHHITGRPSSRRNVVLFFASLACVGLGIAIRLPLLNLFNLLPLLSISSNGRFRLIYALAVSILAGLGLEGITNHPQQRRLTLRMLALLALTSLLVIALTYAGFVLFRDEIIQSGRAYVASRWGTPHFPHSLEHYYALLEKKYDKALAQLLPSNVVMYLPVLITLAYLILHQWTRKHVLPRDRPPGAFGHMRSYLARKRQGIGMWTVVALCLTVLDAFLVSGPLNPTTAPRDVFPAPDAIRFLEQDPDLYRVSATGTILNPNSSMVYGLSDIRGYDAVVPLRYASLVDRMQGHARIGHYSLLERATSPLLDLLNVKYVLTESELGGRWELAFQDASTVKVYRNRNVLPRAFVVYRAEIVEGAQQSLERITDASYNFRDQVLLEERPPDWMEPSEAPSSAADVRVTRYEPGKVSIRVEHAMDGILVLTDTHMPGWRASIDGTVTPIYVADHAFRAVVIPDGTHQVDFVYRPLSFQVGAAVSLAAALALLLVSLAYSIVHIKGQTR